MRTILLILLLLVSFNVRAACSSCSTSAATCGTGTTASQVNTCLGTLTDGGTITVDAGSYTWSSTDINFGMSKGATLACASVGGCTISGTAVVGMNGTCSGTSTKLYRITGFVFSGGGTRIWFNAFNTPPCTLTNIRIDHNTFSGNTSGERILQFGDNSNNSYFYGVIDNNTLTATSTAPQFLEFYSSTGSNAPAGTRGTVTNMFVEDNTFSITTNTSLIPCMDSTGSSSIVWRFNTQTNCRVATHGVTHGGGIVNLEVYGNDLTCNSGNTDCYRTIHHQGSGEAIVFDNIMRPSAAISGDAINWLHYRSASPSEATYSAALEQCDGNSSFDGNRTPNTTYYGYPCKRQPGRDVNAVLRPIYSWNNRTGGGTRISFECVNHPNETAPPATCTHHIVSNRDYYDAASASEQSSATSPFNGSNNGGMGFGTLARRPTSCTTNSDSNDAAGCAGNGCGVGYWATDSGGNWNTSNGTSDDGCLYICEATNTWSSSCYYTPYTYPHPLADGGSNPPDPPSNFRFIGGLGALLAVGLALLGGLYARIAWRNRHRSPWGIGGSV